MSATRKTKPAGSGGRSGRSGRSGSSELSGLSEPGEPTDLRETHGSGGPGGRSGSSEPSGLSEPGEPTDLRETDGSGGPGGPRRVPVANGSGRSTRRDDVVRLAAQLFARKGYRATTVREIADAAGILSGSLYHHFDSKESIGDEILASFMNEILADYRAAVASGGAPRAVLEQIVRTTSRTLARHRAALAMLQNDWSYFATQPRFEYLRTALREVEQTWITQLQRGVTDGAFRTDLDPRLTYRLLRDVLWIPAAWRRSGGYTTDQVVDAFLRLLFDGITARADDAASANDAR
ncbi:MAG TPA: TetR/AcrR family transcriptional regulator [Streptosporangiaceae bacterium]|nr:TetR/AcrR family transcriptional regulator [Streptosporangiaceae bacterium]